VNNLPSLWPGEVESYDGATRTCKVRIPGITDGSTELPEAVLMPPIGDRAQGDHATEQRILPGDLVWLMFEGGDPRFPIIMGSRTPRAGNPVNWRRWRHANIELTADGKMILNAAELEINAGTTHVTSKVTVDGETTINGEIALNGNTSITGTLGNNGTNVGSNHVHGGVQPGGADTQGPH
jgi:phage baseplate assembly protein gpV